MITDNRVPSFIRLYLPCLVVEMKPLINLIVGNGAVTDGRRASFCQEPKSFDNKNVFVSLFYFRKHWISNNNFQTSQYENFFFYFKKHVIIDFPFSDTNVRQWWTQYNKSMTSSYAGNYIIGVHIVPLAGDVFTEIVFARYSTNQVKYYLFIYYLVRGGQTRR